MARRLLPAALILPLLLSWIQVAGERAGLYPSELGGVLLIFATIIAFSVAILATGSSLDRADAARCRAEENVRQWNHALALRVAERTEELEAANAQLDDAAHVGADLAWVGGELIAALDGTALLEQLCRVTKGVLAADFSHVFLWNPEESVYTPVAACGDTAEQWAALCPLKIPQAMVTRLLARLAEDGVVQVCMSEPQDLVSAALPAWYGITVTLYVGLRRGDQIVGVLTAGYRGHQERFTARQERTARGIAHLASLALETKRLVEELQQANRLKSDFVATMSHELRTPLHHIIGYAALLREGEFGEPAPAQAPVLAQVERSAYALLELVEQVLDLSRLEKENIALELREVRLADLARQLEAFARRLPEAGRTRFAWTVQPEGMRLRTDEAKLTVVLKNLLMNAVKFTPAGEVGLTIRESRGGAEFIVRDTGIGIAPEHHAIIFQPFRQLEPHLTRHYGGVGLGLYVVRRLVDALEGSIAVESAIGKGSTFRISVPSAGQVDRHPRELGPPPWVRLDESTGPSSGRRWVGHA